MTTEEFDRSTYTARRAIVLDVTAEQVCFPFAQTAARLAQGSAQVCGKHQDHQASQVWLITSQRGLTPAQMLALKRKYWFIEGVIHQRLDNSYLQEDKCRVRNRNSACNLGLFRRAVVSVGNHWIRLQRNPRKATLNGFFDAMRHQHAARAFRLLTCENPTWLP